jgi:Ca2+-transporting ATPase
MKEKGLTTKQALELQKQYGKNELSSQKKENFFIKVLHILAEPMFLLLLSAATIYFILGEPRDGIIMLIFVIVIISIDVIQEWKTDKTLNALKSLSAPKITVIRDDKEQEIDSSELVPGDIMLVHEGIKIPADGKVIKCSGLKVDESTLTGESENVWKTTEEYTGTDYWRNDYCYQGTLVIQGTGIIKVDKTGSNTEYGKIGKSISSVQNTKTPLQKQTDKLVEVCAVIAFILFILVGILTYFNLPDHSLRDRLIESILSGITLAMAMIPEEFPVVLTVFLSMGAWRLAKKNSLIKKMPAVETLGAVSVLCVDKTGTITKNQMEVHETYLNDCDEKDLATTMCLCSEEETYDPMEQAMFKYANELDISKKDLFIGTKVKEYPFDNDTKMMGHVWQDKDIILNAKGSPESIIKLCKLDKDKLVEIDNKISSMQSQGLRVIAIANKKYSTIKSLPDKLIDSHLNFLGLVGLIDPPRDNIKNDIQTCYNAGIRVVMITGDNGITASAIAQEIGMKNIDNVITGSMIDKMSDKELQDSVKDVTIFSRVIPEHKMRIVKAFQANGEIVAMTGDGVNDAPALKQAEIGIAMGMRGSEVSREAADLILMDDNFTTIVDTIKDGRRIYDNIKKAIEYIIIIHIPIALSSLIPPLIGINPSDLLLLPLHVVLLELLIDPTCSIVLERQPAESNIMDRKPRDVKENIINGNNLLKSVTQGIILFASSFLTYYYLLIETNNAQLARTMALLIIMIGNIFLVQVNSSSYDYAFESIEKLFKDKLLLLINAILWLAILLIVYSPLNKVLKLQALTIEEFSLVITISFVSIFWYELVKLFNRLKKESI